MCSKLYEREVINGKPYGGLYFGTYCVLTNACWEANDAQVIWAQKILTDWKNNHFGHLEVRHGQTIIRPPDNTLNPLNIMGTVGLKFMVWGRAFKVMRLGLPLEPRGCKSKKKKYLNGKRARR